MIAHNGAETVQAFMNLWGTNATNLSNQTLSGVPAGSMIGTYGQTGNTTGPHLHLEVRDHNDGYIDPRDYLTSNDYTVTSKDPKVDVYSGYKIQGGHLSQNRDAFVQSEAFAQKFFSQPIGSLGQSFTDEMLTVMRANNLFESAGLAAMNANTVLPYLREWYPKASPVEKQKMLEIARRSNPGGYEEWKKLPPYAQQFILP